MRKQTVEALTSISKKVWSCSGEVAPQVCRLETIGLASEIAMSTLILTGVSMSNKATFGGSYRKKMFDDASLPSLDDAIKNVPGPLLQKFKVLNPSLIPA